MSDEKVIYGRLTEAIHISGYTLERAMGEFKWLLEDGRWKKIGFADFDEFTKSLKFSDFKILADQRKEIVELMAKEGASQRATARMLGVSRKTIQRDNGTNVPQEEIKNVEYEDIAEEDGTNVPPPEIPGWMDEGGDAKIKKSIRQEEKEKQAEIKKQEKETALSDIPKPKEKNEISIEPGWYKLNNQYLYFGSNTDKEFIDFLPKDAAFAFADPPYNANVDEWDNGFIWQQDYLQDIAKTVAVTPGGWNAFEFYRQTKMNYQWEMFCWITNGMTHGKCGFANVIKASIFGKQKPKISQDFWKINIRVNETDHTKHKGRKPYEFMYHLIDMFSDKGEKIIDPFAGSGTTLLVSKQMDRISYNAELNKEFCIEIIKRAGHYERI